MLQKLLLILLLTSFSSKFYGQNSAHGPSIKVGYSTLERSSVGIGYNFLIFRDDYTRPAHNYYIEYLPESETLGIAVNLQHSVLFLKAGMEISYRFKNDSSHSYLLFYPHLGFDLINLDLSFGPEIITYKINDSNLGFKISLKFHPKLFRQNIID